MANKRVKTLAEKQYAKELRRIKQFISRAEKRGYRFSDNVIPNKPQKITSSSVIKLRKITPKELYKKATAESSTGGIISGTQRRAEERREVAQRAVETRRARLREVSVPSISFEEARRKQDEANKLRLQQDEEYRRQFEQGMIVYNQIIERINEPRQRFPRSADHVLELLKHTIEAQGFESVMIRLAEADWDAIGTSEAALQYDKFDNRHISAYRHLEALITDRPLTAEEARQQQDIYESEMFE